MVELAMVKRMARRCLLVSPVVVIALWVFGGGSWALSGAIGLAMTLANLWLSATIIGRVAEHNPRLLMPAGLATFGLSLLLLTVVAAGLVAADIGFFPVIGGVLIGSHLVLVLWEATGSHGDPLPGSAPQSNAHSQKTRSS